MNPKPKKPVVGIVMGSDSDFPIMEETVKALKSFDIPHEVRVISAHRAPAQVMEYARTAQKRGLKVIIAGAGGAAHLAGIIAAETTLPVIGVPIESSPLHGIDALLSTAQMPGGVPVATMAVGKAGAKNAAIFSAQILSIYDGRIHEKLKIFKASLEEEVTAKDRAIAERLKAK
ncbi:MAG: phosphoribosylcarboxyaminoimidazole, 5-(carboxyamino)imidazole ribonucleotide mutase [candidate division NC10 bacterium CSP1-5]|nr:MAG: phosphoribosylcarboxyaminoimidazole, 5-(carboxyamino)imidazole ribonucleotide mutase [candidate division NC10 bacterium CSP1-5]